MPRKYSPLPKSQNRARNDSLERVAFESHPNHFDSGPSQNDSGVSVEFLEYTMAPRANWKGYLKLSLVSCAVALYPATSSSARVRFHTLNRATGNRVKRQFIDPQTGEPVESDEQVKGYEVGKGSYILIEDGSSTIRIESTHTIDIESFVPRDQVDERYLETPYYIAPDDKVAQEAFAVIRDAMREKGRAGVARVVIARRERMVLLEPLGKGILATLLRYPYEVRSEEAYFDDIPDLKLPAEMRELAGHIIETKAADFDPSRFEDRYENAVVELIRSKQAGEPVTAPEAPRPSNVVNLMEALRRSIDAEAATTAPKKAPAKSRSDSPGATQAGREEGAEQRAAGQGRADRWRAGDLLRRRRPCRSGPLPIRPPGPSGRKVVRPAAEPGERLQAYKAKRNFAATPEPKGRQKGAAGNRFCVQKHDARRLHFDLRLELDGVLRAGRSHAARALCPARSAWPCTPRTIPSST